MPMVVIASVLRITVDVDELGHPLQLEFQDSIENLSKRFDFTVDGSNYDLRKMFGRRCKLQRIGNNYDFIAYEKNSN